MALAATAAAVDRKKSVFRQALTALRYAVAAAVTVVVVMTAVYAFHVVARSDDLYISVVNSYISLDAQTGTADPKLSFTLSVDNPSGRVRFYYTDIHCVLNVNDTTHNSTAKFDFQDMAVAPDSVLQIGAEPNLNSSAHTRELIQDFKTSNSIFYFANLTLTGNLTVGFYSVYNKTSVKTTYYCRRVIVGNVSGSYSVWPDANCLTDYDS